MFKFSKPFIIILLYVATIMRKNSPNILNDLLLTSPNSRGGVGERPSFSHPYMFPYFSRSF